MPRRSARRSAGKAEAEPQPGNTEAPSDNVVMMVLPPDIAEQLAKSGGQLTPELLTAIAQSQDAIKPVPLQLPSPNTSNQEEALGSTTSIIVTNSEPTIADDATTDSTSKTNNSEKDELPTPIITSSLPSEDSSHDEASPRRVTRNSPKKNNEINDGKNVQSNVRATYSRARGGGRKGPQRNTRRSKSSAPALEIEEENDEIVSKKTPTARNARTRRSSQKSLKEDIPVEDSTVAKAPTSPTEEPKVKTPVEKVEPKLEPATKSSDPVTVPEAKVVPGPSETPQDENAIAPAGSSVLPNLNVPVDPGLIAEPPPCSNLNEPVKEDESLGMSQEDLNHLDAILSTDHAKAILDNLPIDELLDPQQNVVQNDMLDLMALSDGKDFFDALTGVGESSDKQANSSMISDSYIVFLDHSYSMEPEKSKESSSESCEKSPKDKKRASSPIRRSQRQQDKIIKEQVEKIRAENAEAERQVLEERQRSSEEEKTDDKPQKSESPAVVENETKSETAVQKEPKKVEKPMEEPKAAKPVKKIENETREEVKESIVETKETATVKEKNEVSTKVKTEVQKNANVSRRKSSEEFHRKLKDRRQSLGKCYGKKGRIRRESSEKISEQAIEVREAKMASGMAIVPKKDKKLLKKDKTPEVKYLSMEPALFSKPDVIVTKAEVNGLKETESTSKETPESKPAVKPMQIKNVTDMMKNILTKVQAKKSNEKNTSVNKEKSATGETGETLNDIIAELSEPAKLKAEKESPKAVTKPKIQHEKVVKEQNNEDKEFKVETDNVGRKSYPKRENRRMPAHFEVYDQELSPPTDMIKSGQAQEVKAEEKVVKKEEKPVAPPEVKKAEPKAKAESRQAIASEESIAEMLDQEDSDDDAVSDISWYSEDDPERLWCICQTPHNNRFMICCDKCEDWFHGSCVGITKKDGKTLAELGKNWFCPNCAKVPATKNTSQESEPATPDKAKSAVTKKPIELPVTGEKKLGKIPKISSSLKSLKAPRKITHCIANGCTKAFRAGTIFCSDDCIKKYAEQCIHALKKVNEWKLHVKPNASNESILKEKVLMIDRSKDEVLPHSCCPTGLNLQSWLLEHQSCEVKEIKPESLTPINKPVKIKERKISNSESTGPTPPKKTISISNIRGNVSKMLLDAFEIRLKVETDMKFENDEVKKMAETIEKELFEYYNDVGMKYKSKCRSLVFNIKDTKNHGLFRKIMKSKIKPHKLVRMTTEEMASKELAEWREREAKHSLEIIKKDEADRMKKLLKQQKMQKIEIFDAKTADIDAELEKVKILKDAEKVPDKGKVKDTASEHKSHLFDQNCSICTNKKANHHKKSKKSSKDKNRKSSSSKSSSSKSSSGHSKSSSSKHRHSSSSSKSSDSKHKHSSSDSKSKDKKDKQQSSSSKISNDLPIIKPLAPISKIVTEALSKTPDDSVKQDAVAKPSIPAIKTPIVRKEKPLWNGFIFMPDVTKFPASASLVHGPKGSFGQEPPNTIQVCGRIHPEQVFEYLGEIRTSPTRDIVVIQFNPWNEENKETYLTFYNYLSLRKRFGVISNFSSLIKDFYIMPQEANAALPGVLRHLEGPGMQEKDTNSLLGIMVIKAQKRPAMPAVTSPVPMKVPKMTAEEKEIITQSFTPPLKDKKPTDLERESYTPPPVKPPPKPEEPERDTYTPPLGDMKSDKDAKDEPYEPSYTPPLDDGNAPYSPSHMSDEDEEKPYDPEENEKDLQNLAKLQKQLEPASNENNAADAANSEHLIADAKPAVDLEKQRLLLIELTKRVEEQRMSLEKKMMTTKDLLPSQLNTDAINIPPNLAEILKTVQEKSKDLGSKPDGADAEDDAHYSPVDDYNGPSGSTPPSTPPSAKVSKKDTDLRTDPRLANKSESKSSRKDPRQKSSLKNMTESELVERARKQLEEMNQSVPNPSPPVNVAQLAPPLPPPLPPTAFPPPPMMASPMNIAPFPPNFCRPPPPNFTQPPPPMATRPPMPPSWPVQPDLVSAPVVDYPSSEQGPQESQRKRKRPRRQHEHWRGLRRHWQQQSRFPSKDKHQNRDYDHRVRRNSDDRPRDQDLRFRDRDMRVHDQDMRRPVEIPPSSSNSSSS